MGCLGLSDGTVSKFSAQNNGKSPEVYSDSVSRKTFIIC